MPHRIRLRGFWASVPLADGRTRHTRAFNWPRPLPPGEALWVVLALPGPARVLVNGNVVGEAPAAGEAAFPLPPLPMRNELAVDVAGELSDVRLEVRGLGE